MARKPSNPLSEHVQRLEEERARLMREMAAAEKALRQKPKITRPDPTPGRRIRLNNVATMELPQPIGHRTLGGSAPSRRRPRHQPRRTRTEARLAQIKFILLCLLLATLLLLLWRSFPG